MKNPGRNIAGLSIGLRAIHFIRGLPLDGISVEHDVQVLELDGRRTELLVAARPLLYARLQAARRIDDAGYGKSAAAQLRREQKKKGKGGDGAGQVGG